MEKQTHAAVSASIEVQVTIPFIRDICDMDAYEDAVEFYKNYANSTWRSVTPPSSYSPTIIRNEHEETPEEELILI